MDFKDLAGFGKATEKLIETVSSGIGEVGNAIFGFDAKKIRRIGEAEAEVERKKIIAHAEAESWAEEEMMVRAQKRFMLEQYNKQVNMENVISWSNDFLKDRVVSKTPVDKDWVAKFLDVSQGTSDKQLQQILASILAGEVELPGSYSKRLLHVVSAMTKGELTEFEKFMNMYVESMGFFIGRAGVYEFCEDYDIPFRTFLDMVDAGLINGNTDLTTTVSFTDDDNELQITIAGKQYLYYSNSLPNEVNLRVSKYTNVGIELANSLLKIKQYQANQKYIGKVEALLKSHSIEPKS